MICLLWLYNQLVTVVSLSAIQSISKIRLLKTLKENYNKLKNWILNARQTLSYYLDFRFQIHNNGTKIMQWKFSQISNQERNKTL